MWYTRIASEVSSHSERLYHTAWCTNPNENPYHPAHFDGNDNGKDPKTASYPLTTDADYEFNKESYIGDTPPADSPVAFEVHNLNNPKTKQYSYYYHNKLDKQPPTGLVYLHVARFYCTELLFLDNQNNQSSLDPVDNKQSKFLQGIIQIYCDLSSSDEPDIFDITRDQKDITNQLIDFASKFWDEPQKWYAEWHYLATKKNSTKIFVNKLWKKYKPSNHSIDYVKAIYNAIKLEFQDLSINPPLVCKTNWLHPAHFVDLFSNTMTSILDLVFYWPFCIS